MTLFFSNRSNKGDTRFQTMKKNFENFFRFFWKPEIVGKWISNLHKKFNERSKEKAAKTKKLIFFVKNKFYIVYSLYVIDFMAKNAMYEGFCTKINILDVRMAQKCSKWPKMAKFGHFLRCSHLKNIDFWAKPFIHCILCHKIYHVYTIYDIKLIFDKKK